MDEMEALAMLTKENEEMEKEIMRLTKGGTSMAAAAAATKAPVVGIKVLKFDQKAKTEMAGIDLGQPFRPNRKQRTTSGGFFTS